MNTIIKIRFARGARGLFAEFMRTAVSFAKTVRVRGPASRPGERTGPDTWAFRPALPTKLHGSCAPSGLPYLLRVFTGDVVGSLETDTSVSGRCGSRIEVNIAEVHFEAVVRNIGVGHINIRGGLRY